MRVEWLGACFFCRAPTDIVIKASDSYEHFLIMKYARLRLTHFADNIGYARVIRGRGRWVCRSCFRDDIQLHANPKILGEIQIGRRRLTPINSRAISLNELQAFCDYLRRHISRERAGRAIT